MLEDALDAGFVGLSTIRSSFSKLEGARYPTRLLPSTYATWAEYRELNSVCGSAIECIRARRTSRRVPRSRCFSPESSGRVSAAVR